MNRSHLMQGLQRAVREAAALAMKLDFSVEEKNNDAANLVTSSDLAVQKHLCASLSRLLPGSGFLCEEEDLSDTEKEYVWIIDPIDGTTNYARGLGIFAISVALVKNGEALLATVYDPSRDEMFSAVRGCGAFCNGKPIQTAKKPFASSLLCSALCIYQKEFAEICMNIIMDLYPRISDLRRTGSCALELCYLACGRCDLFFEIRVCPWDYAAACLILEEAGGVLRGVGGKTLHFDMTEPLIGAGNPEHYPLLLETVEKYLPGMPQYEKE